MKKISLAFLAFFALTFSLTAQNDISKSRKKTGEISIDGNDKEWVKPLNFYDNGSGMKFAISNDNDRLYLIFSVNDQMKMVKLMRSGWTMELTSKEKKKKFQASIGFPAIQTIGNSFRRGDNERETRAEGNLMIHEYRAQLPAVLLHGFLSGQSEMKLNSRKDIQVGIGAGSDQNLIYEIAIPIKELMVENQIRLNELITLNVNVNPMTRPAGAGSGGRPEGGMSGGGGGRRGGGMSGMGGGRMGGGDRSGYGSGQQGTPFEKASFKQKFVLVGN